MGETAVVIGAGQGIGREVALCLAEDPTIDEVILSDINAAALVETATGLATKDCRVRTVEVDLADPASIAHLVRSSSQASRVALVAGIFRATPSLEVTADEFQRVFAVNTIGIFLAAQGYAREMLSRGDGAICAVASIAARSPRMRQAAYCASKAAMRQALRVLALETTPNGVRINFVSPGPTDTPMMRALLADHDFSDLAAGRPEAYRPPIPSGRVAKPRDVADAVAFLLSPRSAQIAMHDIFVDGGESLGL